MAYIQNCILFVHSAASQQEQFVLHYQLYHQNENTILPAERAVSKCHNSGDLGEIILQCLHSSIIMTFILIL